MEHSDALQSASRIALSDVEAFHELLAAVVDDLPCVALDAVVNVDAARGHDCRARRHSVIVSDPF